MTRPQPRLAAPIRLLVTGASGFLGRYVLAELSGHDMHVVAIGRKRPPAPHGEFVQADLLQPDQAATIMRRTRPTHLLHLAWYAEHGVYWQSPLNIRWLEASVRLAEAFRDAGGRKLVVAGTCAEYDGAAGYCREDATPLAPDSLYGVTKDATRRLLAAVCGHGAVQFAWGRVFLPYGVGEDRRRLIPSLIQVFQGKRAPFGVNAGAYRDFLHAKDVARGFVHLLLTGAEGAYNIASGQPTRIGDIVVRIAARLGGDARAVLDLATERPGEPELLVGDNRKLRALGWQATVAPDFLDIAGYDDAA